MFLKYVGELVLGIWVFNSYCIHPYFYFKIWFGQKYIRRSFFLQTVKHIYDNAWYMGYFLSNTRKLNVLQDHKMDKMQYFMPKCTRLQIICKTGHGIRFDLLHKFLISETCKEWCDHYMSIMIFFHAFSSIYFRENGKPKLSLKSEMKSITYN